MGHPRPPRRLAPADLKGAALDYLDRFAATRARLRQVMLRKIRNSVHAHGDDPAPLVAALDQTVEWLEAQGFLSDRAYAEAKARALTARGTSRVHVIARLASKGVVTEGLGFIYNGCMAVFDPRPARAGSIAPGKARFSSICPSIVFKGGKPYIVVGAPGATQIAMGAVKG